MSLISDEFLMQEYVGGSALLAGFVIDKSGSTLNVPLFLEKEKVAVIQYKIEYLPSASKKTN